MLGRVGDKSQLIIDAGQKRLATVQCTTCDTIYTPGDPHDEKSHAEHHNRLATNLKFNVSFSPLRSCMQLSF